MVEREDLPDDSADGRFALDRRGVLKAAGVAMAVQVPRLNPADAATAALPPRDHRHEAEAAGRAQRLVAQPSPSFSAKDTTSDILIETLIAWGATHVFGIVGDGISHIVEALRTRQDRIAFVSTRHEESAAFMASAYAKHTGRLGVCLATTGPGAAHLVNGLYDAKYDNAPVVVITGSTFHDLEGLRFMQGIDTVKMLDDATLFNQQANSAGHGVLLFNHACRAALVGRGVAHVTIPKDVQGATLSEDRPSPERHGGRTSSAWSPPAGCPPIDQLQAAAELINAGQRVAILAGSGCKAAVPELRQLAELLGAPIAKTYLAKALLPDADPLTTGGIGHLGTQPSSWSMQSCDTVLILGAMMPWIDFYPKPGRARAVQIDIKAEHIGLKYPVEVGLTGDMRQTLAALLPMLRRKDPSFLAEAQRRMTGWNSLLVQVAATQKRIKLRPQTVVRALSDLAPPTAVYSMDAGANTHFAARMIQIRDGQRWSGTGTLVSMASALPYAVAAACAYPDRQSIAVAGDGGFAMLMAELSTAVHRKLDVKVLILNNDAFGEIIFEQKALGFPNYGTDLGHIDFARYAEAVGAKGFSVYGLAELKPTMARWLATPGVALLDVQVDPDEEAVMPDQEAA